MTKEGNIELEAIDTNCNTCKHFERNTQWADEQRAKYKVKKLPHSVGFCAVKQTEVKTNNGLCTPENQGCWRSRRITNL